MLAAETFGVVKFQKRPLAETLKEAGSSQLRVGCEFFVFFFS